MLAQMPNIACCVCCLGLGSPTLNAYDDVDDDDVTYIFYPD